MDLSKCNITNYRMKNIYKKQKASEEHYVNLTLMKDPLSNSLGFAIKIHSFQSSFEYAL